MRPRTLDRVHRRRLATQRLSAAGLPHGADVVRLLTCVQAQDAPLAAWSLALRMPAGTTYADVLAERAVGGWVRTHVLRPTWHLIAPEDLRWVQGVTGPRVLTSLAGRHRGLGLDDALVSEAMTLLEALLAGPNPHTRRELRTAFAEVGLPTDVERLAHLLLHAETRCLVCSGPPRGAEHTYVLADEVVPPGPADSLVGEDARRELTRRFVAGHGPASERDLARWSTLTLGHVRTALADLAGTLEHVELDGQRLWFDPDVPSRTTRPHAAYLLPTFDEVCLSYAATGFPRRDPAATRARLVSESGGGIVVVDGEDVGTWKRVVSPTGVRVTVTADVPLGTDDRTAVEEAAQALAGFLERPLDLAFGEQSG
ncbi:winged helix DNA-binding domain-containing protein [Fodinibacter luteus]|uniref:Winged helix DNA-binding domain-containing protein n=1 Tax=Fodinibacter luteus TaxID=552064 RepID=A0ABP8K7T9_9MICO